MVSHTGDLSLFTGPRNNRLEVPYINVDQHLYIPPKLMPKHILLTATLDKLTVVGIRCKEVFISMDKAFSNMEYEWKLIKGHEPKIELDYPKLQD